MVNTIIDGMDANGASDAEAARKSQYEVSLIGVMNFWLRHPRWTIGLPIVTGVLALLIALFRPVPFVASSQFMPDNESNGSRVAGLMSQLGIAAGAPSSGPSLDFYAELVTTNGILRDAVLTNFDAGARSQNLVEFYKSDGETQEQKIRQAIRTLTENATARVEPEPGLVEVEVKAKTAPLAVAINKRLLELVETFNSERRKSRARTEREFVAARKDEVGRELAVAERNLESFLTSNRTLGSSPELTMARARLQRALDLKQQLYLSLTQAFEQARIDEIRNNSVITVVEEPAGTVRPASRQVIRWVAIGIALGLLIGVLMAAWKEYSGHRAAVNDSELNEFRRLRGSVASRLVRSAR